MSTLYTGSPVNDRAKLVRLGRELQLRGCSVNEHPAFPPLHPGAHIANSKHKIARAIDVNRSWAITGAGARAEDDFFDKLAPELMARGFGVIWNRGNYPGDHTHHLHVETITSRSENYPGRVKLKGRRWTANLKVDGIGGPKSIAALQTAMGTYVDGRMDWGGSLGKALQAFLNTETNAGLVIDGKFGYRSCQALQAYLGFGPTKHDYITRGVWRQLQRRLNAHGHIARKA